MSKKMSINVTINGNPICVKPSKMVISDIEQIKKNERERRKRLRLEQVRQQSKEFSTKVLKRAKSAAKKELSRLERDCKSELKKMHDLKIMEIQRKYQEDMEDIRLPHTAAAPEPDVDAIIEAEHKINRACAIERGKEAMQRLKASSQKKDPIAMHRERLRQVREIEDVRSAMVSKLPIKSCPPEEIAGESDSSEEVEIIEEKKLESPSKKKKHKKHIGKKSPAKVVSKSNIKTIGQHQKAKSPRRIVVEVHRENSKSPKRSTPSKGKKSNGEAKENIERSRSVCKSTIGVSTEIECANSHCNTDYQKPRKTPPTMNPNLSKADKAARYNPEDYKQKTSESSSSTSSSISDDSSYFSDGCGECSLPKTGPKHHTSVASSNVQLYDHSTRQRYCNSQPISSVERIDLRSEPSAIEAALEIIEAENLAANLLESRKLAVQRREKDAALRDRVRRDYDEMMKNFENMARNERVAKKPTVCTNKHTIVSRNKKRQETAEPTCEIIIHDTQQPGPSRIQNIDERIDENSLRDDRERTRTICTRCMHEEKQMNERPRCCCRHDSAEEILETWRKIEQQKRLLLREFGSNLPSTIFNASMTPLFDNRQTSTNVEETNAVPSTSKQPSPEIKIINMSSSEENAKKSSVSKKKSKKTKTPPAIATRTMETAVQTSTMDEIGAAKDKSVQVEIIPEDSGESKRKSEDSRNASETSGRLEYVEPRVIIRTPPEVHNSSSGSSTSRDIVIELDDHRVKVTPRKRKSSSERSSKRETSPVRSKPRSLPSSHPGSPIKKHPISAPSSRSGSPKKHESPPSAYSRSPEKLIDIIVNKGSVKVQTVPSRTIEIIEDSSIDSSVPHSTPEVRGSDITIGKSYRIVKHPTVKKIPETSRDTSDTSTSYASLPPKISSNNQLSRHQITPILEMLDSSANDSVRVNRMDVSPVSTPETPSPRIINVPSNMPHPDRIGRILKFENLTVTGTPGDDSTLFSSTHNERSTSTDPSYWQTRERRSTNNSRVVNSRASEKSLDHCSCSNPTCRLLHDNVNDIRSYATRNHPQVLEKYEDLQNVCTERIASLTELIKRVRNEQRGMEFSVISPADETSLMQLPPPKPFRSDFQSVQRLVESIEAIHGKLARTLRESQRIITNGGAPDCQESSNLEIPASSTSYESKSKGSASTSTEETPMTTTKLKPKVISNEQVNIDLDRLKRGRGPYTTMVAATETPSWPSPGTPRRHEEIVAKLYQEILEQSKTVDNSRERNSTCGECDGSLVRQRTPSPPQTIVTLRKQNSPKKNYDDEVTKDERQSPRQKKDEGFVPLLAGIPKIPRALPSVQPGGRTRPPPAGKLYRSDMNTSIHELSTIVEFDTPDTVNRSQGSTRSPSGKSRRVLQLQSPTKSTSSPRSEKNVKTQTSSSNAPADVSTIANNSNNNNNENTSRTTSRRSTTRNEIPSPNEKLVFHSDNDRAMSERGTTKSVLSQGPSTSIEEIASRKNADGESFDRSGKEKLEREAVVDGREEASKGESREMVDDKLAALFSKKLNIVSGINYDNKNEKLTSTSSNSFSGLSGISEIGSSPTSEMIKWASSSEEIESALKKMGLGWAIVTLKKTREASALSSSSNSDLTPVNVGRKIKSPNRKSLTDDNVGGLPDFSDVSSISIKEASKSTERTLLMKARTSTPNIQNSNSTSEKSTSATTSSSGISVQDHSDSLTAPNLSLTNNKR